MSDFQISAPNIHLSLIILTCERLHHDYQFSCADTHCIQTKTTGLKKKRYRQSSLYPFSDIYYGEYFSRIPIKHKERGREGAHGEYSLFLEVMEGITSFGAESRQCSG